MANAFYTVYKNRIEGSGTSSLADWDTDTIKAVLCSTTYTPSIATDSFYTDIPGGAILSTVTIATISISGGAVTVSGSVTFSSVTGNGAYIVVYKDTGTPSTSPLLILFDTATGLPTGSLSSASVTLNFDASGLFTL